MFFNSKPMFLSNTVLKSELLQESSDYAIEMFGHIYQAYSDGIIEGVQIEVVEPHIIVHPGIIKYQGALYHMAAPAKVFCENTGMESFLKLRFHDEVKEEGRVVRTTELVLTEDATAFPYEMELGRFTLEKGASLRDNYKSFADMATQYNRLNILHVPYAGRGESTVSPQITYQFAKELLAGGTENVFDIAFAMNCIGGERVDREIIGIYLEKRMGEEGLKSFGNEAIYQTFVRVLRQSEKSGGQRRQQPGQRKVIVD